MHPHHNWFISLALTERDLEMTFEAARAAFGEIAAKR